MKRPFLTLLLAVAGVFPAAADLGGPPDVPYENIPYNGLFTFNRVKFTPTQWGRGPYMWGLDLKWNHDYPTAETHLMKILKETTGIEPNLKGGNIYGLDDPELFRYPVAYLSEPGFWAPTDREAEALRTYLRKGGFLIADDFITYHWSAFAEAMRKVLPQGRLVRLEASHPIFDCFFKVDPYAFGHPIANDRFRVPPSEYWGVFEDNDPSRRLMVVANYNQDIGDYWEWSESGFIPIDLSNEAYKLGVNYIVYGLTH